MTTLSASFRTTSWPGRSPASSTFGDTFTRILRPPVKTSAVSSSHALRKTPNPEGGWASRSTSSFSATIWSRASRSVAASRSFWLETPVRLASVSRSLSSSSLTCLGESARRRRSTAISSSRNEICAVRLFTSSSCREARPLSSLVATPPPPPVPLPKTLPTDRHSLTSGGRFNAIFRPFRPPIRHISIAKRHRSRSAEAGRTAWGGPADSPSDAGGKRPRGHRRGLDSGSADGACGAAGPPRAPAGAR